VVIDRLLVKPESSTASNSPSVSAMKLGGGLVLVAVVTATRRFTPRVSLARLRHQRAATGAAVVFV